MAIEVDIYDVTVYVDAQLAKLTDKESMLEIHQDMKKQMNDFVPMKEGDLANTAVATSDYVLYRGPYAHYQYVGIIYGPNIPIYDANRNIIGYWSPSNKQPTGRPINYSREFHPLATHHWDQKMMEVRGQEFTKDVETILKRRLRR